MYVYSTKVFDKDGNDVTGKIKNSDVDSYSNGVDLGWVKNDKNPFLTIKKNKNIPFFQIPKVPKERSIFGKTTEIFSWPYYGIYNDYTIDGINPRCKDGKRIYLAPQGLVVDDETGDMYVSFNLGSVYLETTHGGPNRVNLGGKPNEYANIVPIIKFTSSGNPTGIEYVIGGNHEGFMTFYKDKSGDKRLGIAAYPHGIGTRTGDAVPNGFDSSWTDYYYISKDEKLSYYTFSVKGKFVDNNRNGNQMLHSPDYGGNGINITRHFDTSNIGFQQNPEFHVDPFNGLLQAETPNKAVVETPNVFSFSPSETKNSFSPVKQYNLVNVSQGATNTYQSSCIRGGHFYSTFGSLNKDTKQHEIRVSILNNNQSSENNQSFVEAKIFTDEEIPNFYETEGCWVNEEETLIYFIIKYYNPDNNQESTMRIFKTELNW